MRRLAKLSLTYPLWWAAGLAVPFAYVIAAFSAKTVLARIIKPRGIFFPVVVLLLCVQLLSSYFAVLGPYFDGVRILAILHNYAVFSFILVGAALYGNDKYRTVFERNLGRALVALVAAAFVAGVVALRSGGSFGYSTPFGVVDFVRSGFLLGDVMPRLTMLGLYSNSCAILVASLYFLYSIAHPDRAVSFRGLLLWPLVAAVVAMTGSRIVLAAVILFFPLLWARRQVTVMALLVLAIAAGAWGISSGAFDLVLSSRQDSTSTRSAIYERSLEQMAYESPLLGIGIKPYIAEIPHYPLGSHSSVVGYVYKQGVIGAAIVLALVCYAVWRYLRAWLFPALRGRKVVPRARFVAELSIMMLIVIYAFEDLDAFEVNAFLLGCILAEARRRGHIFRYARARIVWRPRQPPVAAMPVPQDMSCAATSAQYSDPS